MIVNHEYRFIFVKTRKTAGTSVEIALSAFSGPDDIITPIKPVDEKTRRSLGNRGPQNYEAVRVGQFARWARRAGIRRFGSDEPPYSNHARAGVLRRRLDRDVWRDYFKFTIERNPFDRAISQYYWTAGPPEDIDDYVARAKRRHLTNWHVYSIDDEVGVDHIMRYETLEKDLADVAAKLALPGPVELPRAKSTQRTDRRHYSQVLDAGSRARIERVCRREMALMDYAWEDVEDE